MGHVNMWDLKKLVKVTDDVAGYVSIPMEATGQEQCEDNHQNNTYLQVQVKSNDDQNKPRPKSFNAYDDQNRHATTLKVSTNKKQLFKSLSLLSPENYTPQKQPKKGWSLSDNRIGRLNTALLDAIENHHNVEVESILQIGANPNATCRMGHISAFHLAAYDNGDALYLLLKHNADKDRKDKFGRTPLHLAAWAGRNRTIAMLLEFPMDLQYKVSLTMSLEAEEEVKALGKRMSSAIDVPCELQMISILPKTWKDSIEHKCRKYMSFLPKFFSGWTPLHIASYATHNNSTRLLLAAGANVNSKDAMGRTPLDIAGAVCFLELYKIEIDSYVETIKALIEYGGELNTVDFTSSTQFDSALHTAVELTSVEATEILLTAGAPVTQLNQAGNTPLHCCVSKFFKDGLQVLASHTEPGQTYLTVDVPNSSGLTVLQMAIDASWVPGVCVSLEAGADVTFEDPNGNTAIHLAALNGNLDILNEVLQAAHKKNAVNKENRHGQTPLYCAIRSGDLECVQAIIDAGSTRKLITFRERELKYDQTDLTEEELKEINMIVHITGRTGHLDILEFLLDYDKSLEHLLEYRCIYLDNTTPVEYAALYNKFNCFKFLLHKTIERAQKSHEAFDPSMLLELIAPLNHHDMFRELTALIPDAIHIASAKGHFPLHQAIASGAKDMILQLIDHGADLSQRNQHGYSAISLFMREISKPIDFIASIFDCYIFTNNIPVNNLDCEITVDYRILSPSDSNDVGQMMVLKALLNTGNHKGQKKLLTHPLVESFLYLKWKSLSKFFYMIIFLYGLFILSITIYIVAIFYYRDINMSFPVYLDPYIWQYLVYVTLGIIVIQELTCTNLSTKNWVGELFLVETWVKFGSYGLAVSVPLLITMESPDTEWRRHLASMTLVMVWLNIMLLLSRMPSWGYYIQMFGTISTKVVKILLMFSFLIIGFSSCFMIQFHSQEPFNGPWESLIKTLVMMTSEFEYDDIFNKKTAQQLSTSLLMLRVVFLVFLIFAAIVLMNLMIGVAVNDLHNLVLDGNQRRLEKQVEFLYRLEVASGNRSLHKKLGLFGWYHRKKVPQILKIKPVEEFCLYNDYIRDIILNKAQEQLDKMKKKEELTKTETKLDDILKAVTKREENIMSRLDNLEAMVRQIRSRKET